MTLKDHLKRILSLMDEGENVNLAVYDETISQYMIFLNQSADISELKEILEAYDLEFSLPTIRVVFPMFRRLVELDRTPEHLRMLAYCLGRYGPDWDDEAADLHREADEREKE